MADMGGAHGELLSERETGRLSAGWRASSPSPCRERSPEGTVSHGHRVA